VLRPNSTSYKTILLNNFGVVYILQEIVPTSIYVKWEKGEQTKKGFLLLNNNSTHKIQISASLTDSDTRSEQYNNQYCYK
jgi:hypothetical protein